MAIKTPDFKESVTVMKVTEVLQHNNQMVFATTQDGRVMAFEDPEPRGPRVYNIFSDGRIEIINTGLGPNELKGIALSFG